MKNLRISNVVKSFFSMVLIAVMMVMVTLPSNVFASTTKNGQAITDPTTLELISIFPNFKKSLSEKTTGQLVSSNETYIKYTPKSAFTSKKTYTTMNDIEKDFTVQEYTKQQYENEKALATMFIISPQEEVTCSWLSETLKVYKGTGANTYMAYNFSSWKTQPFFKFEDATGISLSNSLTLSRDASSRHAEFNYDVFPHNDRTDSLAVYIEPDLQNGAMATFDLSKNCASSIYEIPYYNTMISTGVTYTGPGVNTGWICGNYLHKEIALGSIGLDKNGVPSVSFNVSSSIHKVSVNVTR